MARPHRRLLALLIALAVLLIASVLLHFAGVDGILLVLTVEVAVAALVLLALPLYVVPLVAERFEHRLPERMPEVADGVLVYHYGPAVTTILDAMERAGLEPVILETDEGTARALIARGRRVVFAAGGASMEAAHGDARGEGLRGPLGDGPLDRIDLSRVRAIVANGGDRANAALLLAARKAGFEREILAIAEEAHHRKPLTLAGANRVFAPRQVLAAALAARASDRISPRIVGAQALGRKLLVSEVKIGPGSPLAGKSLKGADVGRHHGINVIGLWRYGELHAPVDADDIVDPQTILVVAGSHESVTRFQETCAQLAGSRAGGGARHGAEGAGHGERKFLVVGYGEVGRTVTQILRGAGEPVLTIDPRGGEGVDIQGAITDPRVLESGVVSDARAVILAMGGDGAALLAALAIAQHAPYVPILARVDHSESVERIRRAGADYALSISQVSAQLLAGRLLGRESILIHPALEVLKVSSESLVGHHPAELAVRERTGASIVAIERGDEVIVALEPAFTFVEGDAVYVCGGPTALQAFLAAFPAKPVRHAPRAMAASESAAV
ncbi:MAG TPA: NAD-binding protein [Thermoanaerobaculia bacterium]|nr:NAD-binding protein [Thermoanaerobaculia bacterium]